MLCPRILLTLVALCILTVSWTAADAQPTIPKEQIPSDLDAETREVFEQLYSPSPRKRLEAIAKVRNMASGARLAAVPFLVGMLGDETEWEEGCGCRGGCKGADCDFASFSINGAVTGVLTQIGEPAAEALIAALDNEQPAVRAGAAGVLGRIASPQAITPLVDALKDDESSVRAQAAEALGCYREQRVVDALAMALDDEACAVRRRAIDSLTRIGPLAGDVLFAAATDPSIADRQEDALEALAQVNDPRALEQVLEALRSERVGMRRSAACVAWHFKTPEITAALIELLRDPDEIIKEYTVGSLGRIGSSEVVPVLIRLLDDPSLHIPAALWLSWIGDARAVGPLIARLEDIPTTTDIAMSHRETVCRGLERMTGQKLGTDIRAWRSWWDKNKNEFLKEE